MPSRLRQISQSQDRPNKIEVRELLDLAASDDHQIMRLDYNTSVDRQRAFDSAVESRSFRNCTSLDPSQRSILSSRR